MKKKKKSLRPMGDILLDQEKLVDEYEDHGLQLGDVLALLLNHIHVHNKGMVEEYLDGTHPIFKYGPKKD